MILEIVIIGLFVLDMFLTRSYLNLYKERFPDSDYVTAESNPLIRYFVRKHGTTEGIIYSSIFILTILIGVLTFIPESSKWFFVGLYYSVNTHHYVNNRAMKKLIIKSQGGKINDKKRN